MNTGVIKNLFCSLSILLTLNIEPNAKNFISEWGMLKVRINA